MVDMQALIGANLAPEEQAMAEALRQQSRGGDFLSLSTIDPVRNLGQAQSARATTAATGYGGLRKAAQEREQTKNENRLSRTLTREEGQAGRDLTRSEGVLTRAHQSKIQGAEHRQQSTLQDVEHKQEKGILDTRLAFTQAEALLDRAANVTAREDAQVHDVDMAAMSATLREQAAVADQKRAVELTEIADRLDTARAALNNTWQVEKREDEQVHAGDMQGRAFDQQTGERIGGETHQTDMQGRAFDQQTSERIGGEIHATGMQGRDHANLNARQNVDINAADRARGETQKFTAGQNDLNRAERREARRVDQTRHDDDLALSYDRLDVDAERNRMAYEQNITETRPWIQSMPAGQQKSYMGQQSAIRGVEGVREAADALTPEDRRMADRIWASAGIDLMAPNAAAELASNALIQQNPRLQRFFTRTYRVAADIRRINAGLAVTGSELLSANQYLPSAPGLTFDQRMLRIDELGAYAQDEMVAAESMYRTGENLASWSEDELEDRIAELEGVIDER